VVAQWKWFARDALLTVRARRFRYAHLLLRAWLAWCAYHARTKRAQRSELVALIQWKFALQRRCWRGWRRWVDARRNGHEFALCMLKQGTHYLNRSRVLSCNLSRYLCTFSRLLSHPLLSRTLSSRAPSPLTHPLLSHTLSSRAPSHPLAHPIALSRLSQVFNIEFYIQLRRIYNDLRLLFGLMLPDSD
jgi:hypothetical protein